MKPVYFLLYLLFLYPVLLQAQSNFKPGYLVTLEGDTLRGYINYKEWSVSPTSVSLKQTADAETVKEFDVTNSSYFEITGLEAYQRYEGVVTMNPVALDRIAFDAKPQLDSVVVFLKVNYKGDLVDLLSFKDRVKTRFFVQEKDGSMPQELYYNRYYADYNSSNMITQKGYVGQIKLLMNKYNVATPRLNKEIETAEYNGIELEKIISKISLAQVTNPEPKDSRSFIRYYAGVALNSSTVRMEGIEGVSDPDTNPASFMPLLAFGFDVFLNKHIQKVYVRMEGVLTAANYFVDKEIESEQVHRQYTYKISQQMIALCPQLIYSLYNKDNFKWNIGIGGQFNLNNYSKDSYREAYTYTYKDSSKQPINSAYEHQGYRSLMPFWFSYAFRTGAVINKRYEVYARYMPYTAVTRYNISLIEFRSLYFGVNYLFDK